MTETHELNRPVICLRYAARGVAHPVKSPRTASDYRFCRPAPLTLSTACRGCAQTVNWRRIRYFFLSVDDIGYRYWTIPSFVEPLLFANLAWHALSWCRRTSVRPPDDIEKSVAHRLHCAMPLSGNFAIQAPPILVKLAISLRRNFFQRVLRHIIEYGKQRAQVIRRTLAIIQWESTTQSTSR